MNRYSENQLEKMLQLKEELLVVEKERLEGKEDWTIDELEAYLDDIIDNA